MWVIQMNYNRTFGAFTCRRVMWQSRVIRMIAVATSNHCHDVWMVWMNGVMTKVGDLATLRRYACFNTILELSCARSDELLMFDKARYGRNDRHGSLRCRVPYDSRCEIDVQHSLNKVCGGHTRCSLPINTAFFGDPCGYDEFLYVDYICLSGAPTYVIICWPLLQTEQATGQWVVGRGSNRSQYFGWVVCVMDRSTFTQDPLLFKTHRILTGCDDPMSACRLNNIKC